MGMMLKRRGMRGMVVAVLVLIILIVGGLYWWFHRGAGESAFDLAGRLPRSARAVLLFNCSGQLDSLSTMRDIKTIIEQVPEKDRASFKEGFLKEVGVSPDELGQVFGGKGALAVLDLEGKPVAVGFWAIKDSARFGSILAKGVKGGSQKVTVEGVEFSVDPDGILLGHDAVYAYMASSQPGAEILLKTPAAGDTLATDPAFQEARGKVERGGSLLAAFFNIKSTLATLKDARVPYTDAGTYNGLACLDYAVSSWDFKSGRSHSYLKVTNDDSALAKSLLTKGGVNSNTFKGINKNSSSAQGLDVEWFYNVVVAVLAQFPETRQAASAAPMGLMMIGNPFAAFEGEVAFSSDAMELSGGVFMENFMQARDSGQRTACSSNLKNIATALEMYSTDYRGRYPKSLSLLTPNYLKQIPECPAAGTDSYSPTYKFTANPDSFVVACEGNHHGQNKPNLPAYNSATGLDPGAPLDSPPPETPPSFAATAVVKDLSLAHGLLGKGLGEGAGAAPKPGEEKQYPIPNGELLIRAETPPRLCLGFGLRAKEMLDTKEGTLADIPRLKEVLALGNDAVVYADYMNLKPALKSLEKSAQKPGAPAAAKTIVETLKKLDLEGASCVAVEADGVRMTAYGSTGNLVYASAIGAAILVPNFIRARGQGQTTACKSNLKNIGTAMEMWSTDNNGRYPESLSQLTPNYLRQIPECPAAGTATYTLKTGPKAPLNAEHFNDYYYLECTGHAHETAGLPANFPKYTAIEGLIDGP